MKANFLNRFFAGISIVAALSFSALAANATYEDDPTYGPQSQIGIERGLELYEGDAADPLCCR